MPRAFSQVANKVKNLRRDHKGNTIGDVFINHEGFTLIRDDYRCIQNTFDFLSQYGKAQESLGRKFVRVLGELIAGCYGKNGILKMAYFLDGWLFSSSHVLATPPSRELERFRDKPRKRLWMFMMFLARA